MLRRPLRDVHLPGETPQTTVRPALLYSVGRPESLRTCQRRRGFLSKPLLRPVPRLIKPITISTLLESEGGDRPELHPQLAHAPRAPGPGYDGASHGSTDGNSGPPPVPCIVQFRVSSPAEKEKSVRRPIPPRNQLSTDHPVYFVDRNAIRIYRNLWPFWEYPRSREVGYQQTDVKDIMDSTQPRHTQLDCRGRPCIGGVRSNQLSDLERPNVFRQEFLSTVPFELEVL